MCIPHFNFLSKIKGDIYLLMYALIYSFVKQIGKSVLRAYLFKKHVLSQMKRYMNAFET